MDRRFDPDDGETLVFLGHMSIWCTSQAGDITLRVASRPRYCLFCPRRRKSRPGGSGVAVGR
jgi:hypothetical protein